MEGKSLEEVLANSRRDEMDRFSRTQIYYEIEFLLPEKRRKAFRFVNHGLTIVDDIIDKSNNPLSYLAHIQNLFEQSYSEHEINPSTPEEQTIVNLGIILRELSSARFPRFTDRAIGRHTYAEVLSYWNVEAKNLQRRGKILPKKELDKITMGIGAIIASQFLFIIDPPTNPYEFVQLAKAYGMAVKLADNLSDFREDSLAGFVNVPKEDFHCVNGIYTKANTIIKIDPKNLSLSQEYIERESERIEKQFESAQNILLKTRLQRPIWGGKIDRGLYLFGQLCDVWLTQTRNIKDMKIPQYV